MKFQGDMNESSSPKIHAKLNSKESRHRQKLRAESIFQQRRTRLQKGKNSAPESQRVSSLQKPSMKTRMTPKYRARKTQKIDGARRKEY
jgi:hypothetical protein